MLARHATDLGSHLGAAIHDPSTQGKDPGERSAMGEEGLITHHHRRNPLPSTRAGGLLRGSSSLSSPPRSQSEEPIYPIIVRPALTESKLAPSPL